MMNLVKRSSVMVFMLLLSSCGEEGDSADSGNDGVPENTNASVSDVVWDSSNWDEEKWK